MAYCSVDVAFLPVFVVRVGGLDVFGSDDESGVCSHLVSFRVWAGLAGVLASLLSSVVGMRSCRPTRNA